LRNLVIQATEQANDLIMESFLKVLTPDRWVLLGAWRGRRSGASEPRSGISSRKGKILTPMAISIDRSCH
jgi:hypothetical protein